MKLLFLIESMAPESGGPAMEVARLTKLLVKEKGIIVTVACSTPIHVSLPLDKKVRFFQFKNPSFPRLSWFRAISDLSSLICGHDIIFSTGIWGPIDGFALRLAWKQDKPVYIRVCGMLEPYILARNTFKKRLGLFMYVRKNLKKATGVIVNSQAEALNVENVGVLKEKILVIPNGIKISEALMSKEEARKGFGIKPNNSILLFLGRLHPKKGLHFLLKAIASLPENNRQLTLIVAGEFCNDSYRAEIEDMISTLELSELIQFTGLVSGEEKEELFSIADCFILPSQSEGLPNAVLEAMAHGLPAIVTTGCNIPEIADYKAGLVIDLSIPNLTKALLWFLTDDISFQAASKNALMLIKDQFNPEDSLNQYKQIIFSQTGMSQNYSETSQEVLKY